MYHQLFTLRRKYGLIQKEMAAVLRISKAAYQSKEKEKSSFTLTEAIALAEYFDVMLDELFLAEKRIRIMTINKSLSFLLMRLHSSQ